MLNTRQLRSMRKQGLFEAGNKTARKALSRPILAIILLAMTICLVLLVHGCAMASNGASAYAYSRIAYVQIDMAKIAMIESGNNPKAYNKRANAVGLCQITRPVLREYNRAWGTNWTMRDLFNADINLLVATWYFEDRIPELLRAYRIKDTARNRIICYNAGIGNLRKGRIPLETRNYIVKYEGMK